MDQKVEGYFKKKKKKHTSLATKPDKQAPYLQSLHGITSWQIDGETVETVTDFILWAPKSLQVVTAAMKLKEACSLEGKS